MNSEEFIAIMKKGNNATDSDIEVFGNSLSPKFKALGKQARKLELSLEEFKSLADTNVDLVKAIENAQYRAIIPNDKACATSTALATVGLAAANPGSWLGGLLGQWIHCD